MIIPHLQVLVDPCLNIAACINKILPLWRLEIVIVVQTLFRLEIVMVFQFICWEEILLDRTTWILSTGRYSSSTLKLKHKYLFHTKGKDQSIYRNIMKTKFAMFHVSMADGNYWIVLRIWPWYCRLISQPPQVDHPPPWSPLSVNVFIWNVRYKV